MKEESYFYKGFDLNNITKKDKMVHEYFNPYGCNIFASERRVIDKDYNCTHTNQNNRQK